MTTRWERLSRARKGMRKQRGRVCEERYYTGPHKYADCTYRAKGYQRLNDIFVCGVHARAYLNVEPLPEAVPA